MRLLETRTHPRGAHPVARFALLLAGFVLGAWLGAGEAFADPLGLSRSFHTPTFATSALTPSTSRDKAPCDQPECVGRKLDAFSTVRLTGEFGSFTGRVARWSADSLAGFAADAGWGGMAPRAPLGWGQVQQVEKRVSNAGRGAVIGGLAVGALSAVFAITIEAGTHNPTTPLLGDEPNYTQAGLVGGAIGAVVGAGLGAAVGSTSNHWVLLYLRP